MQKRDKFFDDMLKFVGAIVLIAFLLFVSGVLIYGLLGYFDAEAHRMIATLLVFGVVAAFLLGLAVGRSVVRGVERGLDLKLNAQQRASAARTAPAAAAVVIPNYNSLLPRPGEGARITISNTSDDQSPVEV